MIKVEYPPYQPKIKQENNIEHIFDSYRNKWIVLTPEEWVRQNFLNYIVKVLNYPKTLIAIEKEIQLGELKKRFDIVVYDKNTQPWMVIECKEMDVPLTEKIMQQILNYNQSLKAKYLVITNGTTCMAFDVTTNQWVIQMPLY
jgi:hypothetical protein